MLHNATIFHWLALGIAVGWFGFALGLICVGSARVFGYQHVGFGNDQM